MSSQEDSPASLFPMQESGGGSQTTAISGQKCSALLTKSGPLGSLVKMLLESPLWWSPARLLTWEVKPLCSKRMTEFTDSDLNRPSPSNESAEILSQRDIPSSRCLFRLALSEPHTEETGSLLWPTPLTVEVNHTRRTQELKATGTDNFHSRANGESRPNSIMDFIHFHDLLITPTAVMICEKPEKMRERARKNGYQNGAKFGSLESQIIYDPNFKHLLPTPTTIQGGPAKLNEQSKKVYHEGKKGGAFSAGLHDLAHRGLLPTPIARDYKGGTTAIRKDTGRQRVDQLDSFIAIKCSQEKDGKGFRLSPLFTEEMMGFPLMWTTLPFLSQSGETSR